MGNILSGIVKVDRRENLDTSKYLAKKNLPSSQVNAHLEEIHF